MKRGLILLLLLLLLLLLNGARRRDSGIRSCKLVARHKEDGVQHAAPIVRFSHTGSTSMHASRSVVRLQRRCERTARLGKSERRRRMMH